MQTARPSRRRYRHVFDYVRFHARRRPGHAAVMRNGVAVSYAALARDLAAMIAALAAFRLPPGAVAAVAHDDLYVQLLLVFGFEALGVATGSFRPAEGAECGSLLACADLVLAPARLAQPACRRLFVVNEIWLGSVWATAALPMAMPPRVLAAAADPVVVFRSSGTTGKPKPMLVTRAMLEERLATQRRRHPAIDLGTASRFLTAMHFSVGSIYMTAGNCLRLGATFMFDTARAAAASLMALQPTHMTLLPFQLRSLLAALPEPEGQKPLLPTLLVQTIGAKLPEDLRRRTLRQLAGSVRENYGCNEVGAIGMVDEAGLVTVTPGVEAEVEDQRGAALPPGETGLVRVRGPGMVHGYLNDAEATAGMFRDGWFYPGDIGTMTADGQLRLVGRRDDVLNLGGMKVACAELESDILARTAVRDVALLQPVALTASPRVVVCVVADGGFDMPGFAQVVGPVIHFPFVVRVVAEIPRTAEGKIKRVVLRESLFGRAPITAVA